MMCVQMASGDRGWSFYASVGCACTSVGLLSAQLTLGVLVERSSPSACRNLWGYSVLCITMACVGFTEMIVALARVAALYLRVPFSHAPKLDESWTKIGHVTVVCFEVLTGLLGFASVVWGGVILAASSNSSNDESCINVWSV